MTASIRRLGDKYGRMTIVPGHARSIERARPTSTRSILLSAATK